MAADSNTISKTVSTSHGLGTYIFWIQVDGGDWTSSHIELEADAEAGAPEQLTITNMVNRTDYDYTNCSLSINITVTGTLVSNPIYQYRYRKIGQSGDFTLATGRYLYIKPGRYFISIRQRQARHSNYSPWSEEVYYEVIPSDLIVSHCGSTPGAVRNLKVKRLRWFPLWVRVKWDKPSSDGNWDIQKYFIFKNSNCSGDPYRTINTNGESWNKLNRRIYMGGTNLPVSVQAVSIKGKGTCSSATL